MSRSSQVAQILGSLLVAAAIVAVAIWVVDDHFGPTSAAELEVQEERIDAREEAVEERREAAEERREEAEDAREDGGGSGSGGGGNSGPG